MSGSRRLLRIYAAVTFYVVLAGDSLRYSITWYGWGFVALALAVIGLVMLIRLRANWRISGLPYPLLAFVLLTFLSIAWSQYRIWSVAGAIATLLTVIGGVALAVTLTREELLAALGMGIRFALGLSLLFELVVAVFIRHPILPWWVDYGTQTIHPADYWSRDLLFTGKQIQGVMGNSNLLGFVALLGIIVFALQLASGRVGRITGIFWVVVAVGCVLLTRSATVTVAIAILIVATAILLLIRYQRTARARISVSVIGVVVVILGVAGGLVFRGAVLELLGKSGSLTGRTGIWTTVISFAEQRPAQGWGWISYWIPLVYPFNSKGFNHGGIQYLQAHDAWLDVWLQLGIIGLVVFIAFVLSTVVRAWILAVDRSAVPAGERGPRDPLSLLAVLILIALVAQSFTESRLLIEYGMLLLTLFAVRSKRDLLEPAIR